MPCETVIRPGPCKKKDAEKAPVSVNRQTVDSANDWSDYTVPELREACFNADLKFGRRKRAELIALLDKQGVTPEE